MATFEVKCINKQPRDNPYDRMQYIGIETSQGIEKITVADAVYYIENDQHSFYVTIGGGILNNPVYLEVATSPYGNKYVKTQADDREPNNLLSLPECP